MKQETEKNVTFWLSKETHKKLKVTAASKGIPMKKLLTDIIEAALEVENGLHTN